MKNFIAKGLIYVIGSFLISVVIFSLSSALLSNNFAQSFLPEVKHLLSYHLWPSSTPASAYGTTESYRQVSHPSWPPDYDGADQGLFLLIWTNTFLGLLFIKYWALAMDYMHSDRVRQYRKLARGVGDGD